MHIRDTEFIIDTLTIISKELITIQFLMNRGAASPDDLDAFCIFMQDHVNSLDDLCRCYRD